MCRAWYAYLTACRMTSVSSSATGSPRGGQNHRAIFSGLFRPESSSAFTATPNRGRQGALWTPCSRTSSSSAISAGASKMDTCVHPLLLRGCGHGTCPPSTPGTTMRRAGRGHGGNGGRHCSSISGNGGGRNLIFSGVCQPGLLKIAGRTAVVSPRRSDRRHYPGVHRRRRSPYRQLAWFSTEAYRYRVETVIVARPTQSFEALYAQMVGRDYGFIRARERLELIDCVGITGRASLCRRHPCWARHGSCSGPQTGEDRGCSRTA